MPAVTSSSPHCTPLANTAYVMPSYTSGVDRNTVLNVYGLVSFRNCIPLQLMVAHEPAGRSVLYRTQIEHCVEVPASGWALPQPTA